MSDSTTPSGLKVLGIFVALNTACAALIYVPTLAVEAWFGFWSLVNRGGQAIDLEEDQ